MLADTAGRARRASAAGAHLAWKKPPQPTAAERLAQAKAEKMAQAKAARQAKAQARRSDRVQPKSFTSVHVLRSLRSKYSAEQLEWCRRRFPEALQVLGWVVLPEDATGGNMSSYGEAHYMCGGPQHLKRLGIVR